MKNTIMDYRLDSEYRNELDLEAFNRIADGTNIAIGEGKYPEIDPKKEIRWVAIKSVDGDSWTIMYGDIKRDTEYIVHNGDSAHNDWIPVFMMCTEEVKQLYRQRENY